MGNYRPSGTLSLPALFFITTALYANLTFSQLHRDRRRDDLPCCQRRRTYEASSTGRNSTSNRARGGR